MLLNSLVMVPADSRLVDAVLLHTKFSTETKRIVLKIDIRRQSAESGQQNEQTFLRFRSEERRVGKGGRTKRWPRQAEDGIRDGHVTGVQTCALPISAPTCDECFSTVS